MDSYEVGKLIAAIDRLADLQERTAIALEKLACCVLPLPIDDRIIYVFETEDGRS